MRLQVLDMPNGRYANKRKTGHRTDIEAIVEQHLVSVGVPYQFEVNVGRFAADFLLTELHLAVDCDGSYWHRGERQLDRDQRKATAIEQAGYQFVRLSEAVIRSGAFIATLEPFLRKAS